MARLGLDNCPASRRATGDGITPLPMRLEIAFQLR
jgi:hypothetical protein